MRTSLHLEYIGWLLVTYQIIPCWKQLLTKLNHAQSAKKISSDLTSSQIPEERFTSRSKLIGRDEIVRVEHRYCR
ncbi:hypothetical protein J6590_001745 [Homalodisca vitripennis]|nr:hypothetical protein J6590_001745 [Homalodisca vitripennis]